MNDAGLTLTHNEVNAANDGSPRFNAKGMPTLLLLRRVLEDCATVADAERTLRATERASMALVTMCDPKHGAVLESTTKSVAVRRSSDGICACTNHFRSKELATAAAGSCWRYPILEKSRALERLGLADVKLKLAAVNQGAWTIQTMIFEPAALKLHLAFGKGPATGLPLKTVELEPCFKTK